MKKFFFLLLSFISSTIVTTYAQSLPVGFSGLEELYRREQLLGNLDSSISFTSRPFFSYDVLNAINRLSIDTLLASSHKIERVVHNNDFHYQSIKDIRAHWVDLGVSLPGQRDIKGVLLHEKIQEV